MLFRSNGDWIGGVRGYDENGNEIKELTEEEITTLKYNNARIYGGYRQEERIGLELGWLGSWFMTFHRFIPYMLKLIYSPGITTVRTNGHFGFVYNEDGKIKMIKDEQGIERPILQWMLNQNKGQAPLVINNLQHLIYKALVGMHFFKDNPKDAMYEWKNLSTSEKQNIVDFYLSFGYFLAILAVCYGVGADDDDDNVWKKRLSFLKEDMIQGYNPLNLTRMAANPIVVTNKTYEIFNALNEFISSGGVRVKQGKYKGEFKGMHTLKKDIAPFSIINHITDFYEIR